MAGPKMNVGKGRRLLFEADNIEADFVQMSWMKKVFGFDFM